MAAHLKQTFETCKAQGRPAFVTFVTAGFPTREEAVDVLLALEAGGADIIELGVPFSDPLADGPTIQFSTQSVLDDGVDSLKQVFDQVKEARKRGLQAPIVLMGYYNPLLIYGEEKAVIDSVDAGVDGYIVVDLPPEEAENLRSICHLRGLSYVPLIAPTTVPSRIEKLSKVADSFIYVVSVTGVTGARDAVSSELPQLIAKIRENSIPEAKNLPLAVGFGVSTREHFESVSSAGANGVVIGSAIINILRNAEKGQAAKAVQQYCENITGNIRQKHPVIARQSAGNHIANNSGNGTTTEIKKNVSHGDGTLPDRFGDFGGRYVPEILVEALEELEKAFIAAKNDPKFKAEVESHFPYIGRPSSLHVADRLTKDAGGARIWLKREDLNHTGSHKINNAIAQCLLAMRLGKKRIIAETGAGQHGVATATVCAKFGLQCVVYMGSEDVRRQALNVFRMKMLGAKVVPVESGTKTLKDAINEAMRDWATNVRDTHYLVGSAIGPHPFPTIVRDFQSIIGTETREQILQLAGKLPDAVIACVGGGSNSIGMFHPFINDKSVRLIGVEAGGDGLGSHAHSATLSKGVPGVLHGTRTYLLQDEKGQIMGTHSISAGLDYPGVGPEHAWLKDSNRAEYVAATDREALLGFKKLAQLEGILPALETSHAIYYAHTLAATLPPTADIVICLSGRGDKDLHSVAEALPSYGCTLRI